MDNYMSEPKFKLGILTVSDKGSQWKRRDTSGEVIREVLSRNNFSVTAYDIVPDEIEQIRRVLINWADVENIDIPQIPLNDSSKIADFIEQNILNISETKSSLFINGKDRKSVV